MLFVVIDSTVQARRLRHVQGNWPTQPSFWIPQEFEAVWAAAAPAYSWDADDGVVVCNRLDKRLLSLQSYSDVTQYIPPDFGLRVDLRSSQAMQHIRWWWDNGCFSHFDLRKIENLGSLVPANLQPYSSTELSDFDAFCAALERQQFYPTAPLTLPLNPLPGWTVLNAEDHAQVFAELAAHCTVDVVEQWQDVCDSGGIWNAVHAAQQAQRLSTHVQEGANLLARKM